MEQSDQTDDGLLPVEELLSHITQQNSLFPKLVSIKNISTHAKPCHYL